MHAWCNLLQSNFVGGKVIITNTVSLPSSVAQRVHNKGINCTSNGFQSKSCSLINGANSLGRQSEMYAFL